MRNLMLRTVISIGLTIGLWLGVMTPANAAIFSFAGEQPTNLGVTEGRLAPCPATPNCVSSQAQDDHQIAPLAYVGSGPETMAKIKQAIVDLPGSAMITDSGNYLYAQFTSKLLGFVDDVEFYCDDAAGVIQVRSASRLGESDLGVNAKRIAAIRAAL
ncbi:MAG: DUF1499 domain-containing protein [Alkalinema sp. RL_2_19]|nr:DUF1499 domain-containing protein [Alkalinema sp. RL_2_19]